MAHERREPFFAYRKAGLVSLFWLFFLKGKSVKWIFLLKKAKGTWESSYLLLIVFLLKISKKQKQLFYENNC